MFRVKICGITNLPDARAAVAAGADAIGLNFYARSPRCCGLEQARAIAAEVPSAICKVGVFVNATAEEIRRLRDQVGLDAIQLHGDEPAEFLSELRGLSVLRAFRVQKDYSPFAQYLGTCHRLRGLPRMVLVDAARGAEYGGTGCTLDWQALAGNRQQFLGVPLVLAGGLTPANVAAAIATVRPWAVDVASGVESSVGQKSATLVGEFVAAAHAAFAKRPPRHEASA